MYFIGVYLGRDNTSRRGNDQDQGTVYSELSNGFGKLVRNNIILNPNLFSFLERDLPK